MILFVCESNSARSPIAEAIFSHLCPSVLVQSAGFRGSYIRPQVRLVLEEHSIDHGDLRSKDLFGVELDEVSLAIVLCLPEEAPRLPRRIEKRNWPLPDPLSAPMSEWDESFRECRDDLWTRITKLVKNIEHLP
ncbi:MAG: hypothetical protein VX278_20825 [Myxococcota bacterium]|nr:hypothetical protein [Myxococcota bacterium]